MKVKVILLDNIKSIGKKDEVIEVKDGYANNFLYPQKKAVPATPENLNKLKAKSEKTKKTYEKEIDLAKTLAENLKDKVVILQVKAGENGKVFGSIGAKEIADEMLKQLNISVDKKKFSNDARIKSLGIHSVELKLHSEVKAFIKVEVKGL
ncbi:50S ribosomal protein L9 [Caviibacter abscessus]|uniref:50S ribosomal protein L9 n=1 Tax=Caviibacter abscessus TaxID=1766719 RepID=UPI000836630D|nr:50S ribosomal protein L9 [Caviibacter abscessus]